jgi:hypothetical protein
MTWKYRLWNPEPMRFPPGPWLLVLFCAGLYLVLEQVEAFRSAPVFVRLLVVVSLALAALIAAVHLLRVRARRKRTTGRAHATKE